MLSLLRKWFLTGLLVLSPIVITCALIAAIVSFTDNLIQHLAPEGYEPSVLLGMHVPGLGLILTLLAVTSTGALISNFMGRYFIRVWDRLVARVPFVNGIYGGVKQVLNSVLSEQGQSFREVVYVEFPQSGQYAMGFVIGQAPGTAFISHPETLVSVFIPMVPLPTSGFMITLPHDKLIKTNMTVEEGLKLTVTLGMVKN